MSTKVLTNTTIFDGDTVHQGLSVVVADGRVAELTAEAPSDAIDLQGCLLAPGLVDIQVNGGGGVLFNDAPTVETIRTIGAAHRRFGTTGFLPTLISTDPETMAAAISAVRTAIEEGVPGVLGIHLEGPFLHADRRGIHDANRFRVPDAESCRLAASLDKGCTLVTVAPEVAGPKWIRSLVDAGAIVFGGHSAASYEQVRAGLDAGMTGFTHLFNAMTPFTSREPGMVGAALEDRHSYAGIICDGHHVHPASFAVAVAAKGSAHCLLVTDAMATVGARKKTFEWNGQVVSTESGSCRLPDGTLAGSSLDMIDAVRNAMRFAGIDRLEALRMASLYAARAIGLDGEIGKIAPGYRADFVELDDDMNLLGTWIDGRRYDPAEERN